MIGRELDLTPGSYRNVVCIGAGALRIYSYIGDISQVCGVEDIDNLSLKDRPKMFDPVARPYMLAYGEAFSRLPSCGVGGPNAQTAEAEKILSCAPDIVISEYKDVDKEDALQQQLGVPVVTMSAGKDGVFDDSFRQSLRLLGIIFENESRAEEIISFIDSQTADISARTGDIADEDKPSVYICGLGNWGTTDHLTTSEEFRAFEIAHIKNVISGTGASGTQPIEEEKFVAIGDDIDIMIIDSAAVKNIAPLYQEDSTILDSCRAWREGNTYLQMAYNAYYTNFELSLINAWYAAKTVYPDRFEDIDIKEKTDEITTVFLGKPLADDIYACPASYGGYQKIDTATFFTGDDR